ncbi:hypothetical protein [Endozoicomonas sp. GU-1]|uniref:hypothetical protein n=1 Tax=Endozoicomonas sp. GU-1 TaxID=3009078 RepID=UPI0022B2CAA2|nr:hypothetical protein [Endozoicomonas sp. GU-1]WBA79797.1 hypothetical protein O2T12_15665 [Endozoicomonas sp. GU-1]WBA87377.1 hypothetical protein O3276_04925 [Endozoicomonas sp. GU-1]
MLVSAAAHHNRRLIDYKKAPKNHHNKRKQQQENNHPSKKVRLYTVRINHQGRIKQTGLKKKLPEYQVAMAKSQPVHQNSQIRKQQIDSKQSTESHSIPTILNRVLDDIRKMDIEYALGPDKSAQMPKHKRLSIHGNITCVEKIYQHLLVPKIHHLIQESSPINDVKQRQTQYAMQIAELVKTYKVAQCDEMTHLMASCCLENPTITLFKMVINFFFARTGSKKGKLDRSTTHVCLMVCPKLSGDSVQMQSQWYEAGYKHTYSDLYGADGSYHKPPYMATSDLYIADPCQYEYWPGSQWQQFISSIADQYLTPTGKDFKKIKVQITRYHSETAVNELPATDIQTVPVNRASTDYSAIPAYFYLEEFVNKLRKKVQGEKQRAIEITKKRLVRNAVKIPAFDTVKSKHRKKWSTHLIRVLAWKMNLDVNVLCREDLAIINPKSEDYYQYIIDFLGKSIIESSKHINNMTNSFNKYGFPFPEPCRRCFLPSKKWLPGHIRHLLRVAKPERSLSDGELIKVLRVLNPVELQDTYLRYLHEYLQNKLVDNPGPRVLENALSSIKDGPHPIPLPAIAGFTNWNILTLRKLADLCVEKFGGISAKTVTAYPSVSKREVIPTSHDEFTAWFLHRLTNNQFNFNNFDGKLKTANLIIHIPPIEGITFNPVPKRADWILYYVYQYGFDKKEIFHQTSSTTLYQMLKRITSREKHSELYDRLLYLSSTWSDLKASSYLTTLRAHNIKLPDDLMYCTAKSRMIKMHARAEKLKESGWLAGDIDLSQHQTSKHKNGF